MPDALSDWSASDGRMLVCAHGFARLDFLKLDIEGMEALVIQSMAPLIAARRPKLYIEIVASQLARFGGTLSELDLFFRAFGYRFFRNTGERNSANDRYIKRELSSLERAVAFSTCWRYPTEGRGSVSHVNHCHSVRARGGACRCPDRDLSVAGDRSGAEPPQQGSTNARSKSKSSPCP
jgi:hypothetical protein